jgi:REP element-mobilizing transposase RayT
MSRGVDKQTIYRDATDYSVFLNVLEEVTFRYNVLCHAYCLMPTHYHVVLETPEANLSAAMQQLNGCYGRYFNRRHSRIGHLFQGRFKDVLVQKSTHLLELSRYVVLNPVRGRLVHTPGEWQWSSYRATAGFARRPEFLTVDWILRCFEDGGRLTARRRYVNFVAKGLNEAYLSEFSDILEHQPVIGDAGFVSRYRDQVDDASSLFREVPRKNRLAGRPDLAMLFAGVKDKLDRDGRILDAHLRYGYMISEISRYLGLHRTTVSRVVAKAITLRFTV